MAAGDTTNPKMTISGLIRELEAIRATHGDLPVYLKPGEGRTPEWPCYFEVKGAGEVYGTAIPRRLEITSASQ